MICAPAVRPIPQLEFVRDTSYMRRVFQSEMADAEILDCAVMNVRYKPAKSCLVSYRLSVSRHGMDTPEPLIVAARFYPPGGSASRFRKAQLGAQAIPAFSAPVFHIPALHAVVWAFPNDRKLPAIAALTDEKRIALEVVPRLVAGGALVSLDVVRYIAEHGCTVKIAVQPADGRPRHIFYGKTYSDDKGWRTWRNMNALWNSDSHGRGTLRMARPMLYEAEHLALWQSEVCGPTLAKFEASGPEFIPLLQTAGRAVAALHRTPVPGLPQLTVPGLHANLRDAELCLRQFNPLAGRVSRIIEDLIDCTPATDARPAATLHGDLHAKNVLLTSGSAALIDLDSLRAGDPMHDLGSFVASTCARSLAREIAPHDVAPMIAALVRAYEASVPWEVPRSHLRWYTAASIIAEQAHRTVIRMKTGSIDALLGLAEQSLAGAGPMEVLSCPPPGRA
jgi:hypothetical protein